mgnify:CR=1 FL=1
MRYASNVWALTKTQVNDLQKKAKGDGKGYYCRREKGKDKESKKEGLTKVVDVGYVIKIKKYKYAGHMMRGRKERWAKE